MKTSNKIITGLIVLLMSCIVGADLSLNYAYKKINLDDPFKNYESLTARPFKFLKIKGGNSFSIVIEQDTQTSMKVMSSRRSFLDFRNNGDTLLIQFNVASSRQAQLADLPVGLIISSQGIAEIDADGTNNLINNWCGDTLKLTQTGNAETDIAGLNAVKFTFTGVQNSLLRFQNRNNAESLNLTLMGNTAVCLKEISYKHFSPILKDESQLIFFGHSIEGLKIP